jgi:hypothetical protein
MRSPRLSAALLALAAFLPIVSCGKDESGSSQGTAAQLEEGPIQADASRIVLDRVNFGDAGFGYFTLRNTTDQTQRINRIGPASCSCTSLRLLFPDRAGSQPLELTGREQDIEVLPGEELTVEVKFDTSRMRRSTSRKIDGFAVMVEGARGPLLEYAVDVWTPFWVEPWNVAMDRVGVRERAKSYASVKAHDAESEFELIVPETIEGWSVSVRKIESGSADFSIEFQAPEELPQGPFDIRVPITTNLPDSPTMTIAVQGIAVPDLDWSPQRVTFAPDANGRARARVILSTRAPARPLSLRAVIVEGLPQDFANQALKTSTTVLKAEQSYAVDLELSKAPSERMEAKLILVTDDPDQPRIEIPLVLRPRTNS